MARSATRRRIVERQRERAAAKRLRRSVRRSLEWIHDAAKWAVCLAVLVVGPYLLVLIVWVVAKAIEPFAELLLDIAVVAFHAAWILFVLRVLAWAVYAVASLAYAAGRDVVRWVAPLLLNRTGTRCSTCYDFTSDIHRCAECYRHSCTECILQNARARPGACMWPCCHIYRPRSRRLEAELAIVDAAKRDFQRKLKRKEARMPDIHHVRCPFCHVAIYRVSGCDTMMCEACGCAFDFATQRAYAEGYM